MKRDGRIRHRVALTLTFIALLDLHLGCADPAPPEGPLGMRASAASAATGGSDAAAPSEDPSDPNVRIRFYEAKLVRHPRLFAGHAELAAAYLDKARETHDVSWLGLARKALERSLEIQPNLNAFATMAALCNFSHRFSCALEFAERLARANPRDGRLRSLGVEANLGLGRIEEAKRLLDAPRVESEGDPVLPASRGRWFAEQKRYDEARDEFVAAAELARKAGATDLAIWAETNAAGMLIDSKRPEAARSHLERASALPAGSRAIQSVLRVHWAEFHALRGESEAALKEYEALIAEQDDPEILRRAFVLARSLGMEERAGELFAAAERAAQRILDAGEIFALEAHARLYADAGVELERAEELAVRNLEHKRDRSAQETLDQVRRRKRISSSS